MGVKSRGEAEDVELVQALEQGLTAQTVEIDRFCFDWAGGARRGASPADTAYASDAFAPFTAAIAGCEPSRTLDHPYWAGANPCSMHIEEVESLWKPIADADDWGPLYAKVAAIRAMGAALGG